jgi:hypothetical protein
MEFPRLKTGAVAQYGSVEGRRFATRVYRFVDGGEQRFRVRGEAERRWVVKLSRLDEGELAALDRFFQGMQGPAQEFEFQDPRTGEVHGRCRLDEEVMALQLRQGHGGEAEIGIVEVRD